MQLFYISRKGEDNMKLKIVGQNSSNRLKLLKNINKAVEELPEDLEIELIEDQEKFSKYQVFNTPALIINDKIISQGKVLNEKEIRNYIRLLSN